MLLLHTVLVLYLTALSSANSKTCSDIFEHQNCDVLPRDRMCGDAIAYEAAPRIVGGENAKRNEFPWIACIKEDTYPPEMTCLCGGSLITERHVLTAAHCVWNESRILVILGEHDLRRDPDCNKNGDCAPNTQRFVSSAISVHESFDRKNLLNDIALITLEQPVYLNPYVLPICLPLSGFDNTDNMPMTAAGWGRTKNDNTTRHAAYVLKKHDFETIPIEQCKRKECKEDGGKKCITDDNICLKATDENGVLHYVWKGDSGGPVMVYKTPVPGQKQCYLLGVNSFTNPGTINGKSVSTRVSSYIDWILDHL